ncbi:hypothetical protein BH10PSE16_BH10PSE16_03980 [soil metagenome]
MSTSHHLVSGKAGPSRRLAGSRASATPKAARVEPSMAEWAELGAYVSTLNPVSRHTLVSQGVSTKMLYTLLDSFERTSKPEIFAVVGFSSKTANRRKDTAMSLPVSDATLSLIEIKSLAESVLGSSAEAEEWLNKPALALDGYKPIALIATRAGAELVKDLLIRLDYGVSV